MQRFHQSQNNCSMPQGFVSVMPLLYINFTDVKGG